MVGTLGYKVCTINTTNHLQITDSRVPQECPQQFEEAVLNSPLALRGATSHSVCSRKHQTPVMKRCCSHYMLQDTKWERQLPVSRLTYCTLPYHKLYSKSNSVVVLPVIWYRTHCLKIMLVIFSKMMTWNSSCCFFLFWKSPVFSFIQEEEKKEKALRENLVLFQSQMSWLGRTSCMTS